MHGLAMCIGKAELRTETKMVFSFSRKSKIFRTAVKYPLLEKYFFRANLVTVKFSHTFFAHNILHFLEVVKSYTYIRAYFAKIIVIDKSCESVMPCKYFHKKVPFNIHIGDNFCLSCLNPNKGFIFFVKAEFSSFLYIFASDFSEIAQTNSCDNFVAKMRSRIFFVLTLAEFFVYFAFFVS
jgi:hypothetical protein